jgi:hypothetical protein
VSDFLDHSDEIDDLAEAIAKLGWVDADDLRTLRRSAVVGTAELVEVHEARKIWSRMTQLERSLVSDDPTDDEAPEGAFFWELRDQVEIEAVPSKGKLRLWTLPDGASKSVSLREAAARLRPVTPVASPARIAASKQARIERRAEQERQSTAPILRPSPELAAIVGKDLISRLDVTRRIWEYIKANDLQDTRDPRFIRPDTKLSRVLGKARINMFDMTVRVVEHVEVVDE